MSYSLYGMDKLYFHQCECVTSVKQILLLGEEHTPISVGELNKNDETCLVVDEYIAAIITNQKNISPSYNIGYNFPRNNKYYDSNNCIDLYLESFQPLSPAPEPWSMLDEPLVEKDTTPESYHDSGIRLLNTMFEKCRTDTENVCEFYINKDKSRYELNNHKIISHNVRVHNVDIRYSAKNKYMELSEFVQTLESSDILTIFAYIYGVFGNIDEIQKLVSTNDKQQATAEIMADINQIQEIIIKQYTKFKLTVEKYIKGYHDFNDDSVREGEDFVFDLGKTRDLRLVIIKFVIEMAESTDYNKDVKTILLTDLYIFTRIFREFDIDDEESYCPRECKDTKSPDNIIVCLGMYHTELLHKLLNFYFENTPQIVLDGDKKLITGNMMGDPRDPRGGLNQLWFILNSMSAVWQP